jgi:hypothetical protein
LKSGAENHEGTTPCFIVDSEILPTQRDTGGALIMRYMNEVRPLLIRV